MDKEKMEHTNDHPLNRCYYALMDIEDLSLRKKVFNQIQAEYFDVYSFDGTEVLEISSNYLPLRLNGLLPIEGKKCKVPVEYWCTDGYGDVWQEIGIYDGEDLQSFPQIDYRNSFTERVFEFSFKGEDFLIVRIDTSCCVETRYRPDIILLGIDLSSVPVLDFSSFYKEFILYADGADWNKIPVHSYELDIAGTRLPLRCEKVETDLVYLSLGVNHAEETYSFTVSALTETKIIINIQENDKIKPYAIPLPLPESVECLDFLDLAYLCDEMGLELDFLQP